MEHLVAAVVGPVVFFGAFAVWAWGMSKAFKVLEAPNYAVARRYSK